MTNHKMQMIRSLHAVVYGYVQGVSYRAYAQREANRLGLTGWVRNKQDGSVEVLVEGEESLLEHYASFLAHCSPHAGVERVTVEWREPTHQFAGFNIRLF